MNRQDRPGPANRHYTKATSSFGAIFPPLVLRHSLSDVRGNFNMLPIGQGKCRSVLYECPNSSFTDQSPPPSEGDDFCEITAPHDEQLITDFRSQHFIKLFEYGCINAEQIAHRNRNKSFFRKLQDVCARTRSAIVKPCKTIPNINSHGISWVTRDWIYAFLRLIDSWYIMRGYWENRDGSGLDIIEKFLSPEFKSCYPKWETLTLIMASDLMTMFCTLDASMTNLYDRLSQVNLNRSSSEETGENQIPIADASTPTNSSKITPKRIVYLPVASVEESADLPADQIIAEYVDPNILPIGQVKCRSVQYECPYSSSTEQSPPPSEGDDFCEITAPDDEQVVTHFPLEYFIKRFVYGCINAEQIAHRNRNRSFFRKLQDLCARTRSAIVKPCKTVSNINSHGISWATRDSIYAFLRLIDSWYIIRDYWENRDGRGLDIIGKFLSPEAKSRYLEWEKLTLIMASDLMTIFCTLDASSSRTNLYDIPSQVNQNNSPSEETAENQEPFTDFFPASTLSNSSKITPKGIIDLPVAPSKESADQTISDSDAEENCNQRYFIGNNYSPESLVICDPNRVQMKLGDCNVSKKGSKAASIIQGIEFSNTAQPLCKEKETSANFELSGGNKDMKVETALLKELGFEKLKRGSEAASTTKGIKFLDTAQHLPKAKETSANFQFLGAKEMEVETADMELNLNPHELPGGGITETGLMYISTNLINGLMELVVGRQQKELYKIVWKLIVEDYLYVNEVVRDLKYLTKMWDKRALYNNGSYAQKLKYLLIEHFLGYDFKHIEGYPDEPVGPLKLADCDSVLGSSLHPPHSTNLI